jgi:hypothetical protein
METLFLAFSNSQENPLPTLKEEQEAVQRFLVRRQKDQDFRIHLNPFATISQVAEYLHMLKDDITVFLFSGHADRDQLLLNEEKTNSHGVAQLLGQCPKLKLVILNGCATGSQVTLLSKLKNRPVVIATRAPVDDWAATQFSKSFFQVLCEEYGTVLEAFDAGLGAAQMRRQQPIRVSRGLFTRGENPACWVLHYQDELEVDWRLPIYTSPSGGDFEPNLLMIDQLVQAFAPFNEEVEKIVKKEADGERVSILDKRQVILTSLPHPISEQLRKLIVPNQEASKMVFYDRPGPDRLRQMTVLYETILELCSFVMLSQLWNALNENDALELPEALREKIKRFFSLNSGAFDYLPLIRSIHQFIEQNGFTYFIEELESVSASFEEQTPFYTACRFMERTKERLHKKGSLEKWEAAQLSMVAERKLTLILGQIGFISRYTVVSVMDIDVLKYRHENRARFKHRLVRLVQSFVGLEEESEELPDYLDTASVLLMPSNTIGKRYLNLSPFIIDENAFEEKQTNNSKLHFFFRYVKEKDAYYFKHVYKPDDLPLEVKTQRHFKMIKAQFDAFAELVGI